MGQRGQKYHLATDLATHTHTQNNNKPLMAFIQLEEKVQEKNTFNQLEKDYFKRTT